MNSPDSEKIFMHGSSSVCRSCGEEGLAQVLSLGRTPLADALLGEEDLVLPEATYRLDVAFCPQCSLMQILETVPPDVLFRQDYPYFSSFSDTLLRHVAEIAERLIKSRHLNPHSLVIELASNDGYLLQNYVRAGIPVWGIDPAANVAKVAESKGVRTICEFFGEELAWSLQDQGLQADVIHANNVLAHVADTNGFVEGIRILLKEDGVAVVEVPYVRDLIDHCEFDTIYHEHLCYFSVTSLGKLFGCHELYINDVERMPIHGGSLRLFISHQPTIGPSVTSLLDEESAHGTDRFEYYESFANRSHHPGGRLDHRPHD